MQVRTDRGDAVTQSKELAQKKGCESYVIHKLAPSFFSVEVTTKNTYISTVGKGPQDAAGDMITILEQLKVIP